DCATLSICAMAATTCLRYIQRRTILRIRLLYRLWLQRQHKCRRIRCTLSDTRCCSTGGHVVFDITCQVVHGGFEQIIWVDVQAGQQAVVDEVAMTCRALTTPDGSTRLRVTIQLAHRTTV